MRIKLEGSEVWPYGNKTERTYKWEQAKKACPKGGHLPSDGEWKSLEYYLGMAEKEVESNGYRGDIAHKFKGKTILTTCAYLDLITDISWNRIKEVDDKQCLRVDFSGFGIGRFWTVTELTDERAWYRGFNSDDNKIYRYHQDKMEGSACRCIMD